MMEQAHPAQPLWLRILQFPLTRVIVLGGLALSMMAWTESRILAFKDSPLIIFKSKGALKDGFQFLISKIFICTGTI